jgi:hypothetical protein
MEKPQPTGQGLVFLHRKIRELPFYKTDSEAVHLWVHLIMDVNLSQRWSPLNLVNIWSVVGRQLPVVIPWLRTRDFA